MQVMAGARWGLLGYRRLTTGGSRLASEYSSTWSSIMRGLFLLLLLAGCHSSGDTRHLRSERERDSIIGASKLPGSAAVRGALRAADSGAARSARVDSLER